MKRALILILALLPGMAFATTPTILSVSGSPTNGSTLTIAGTSMMDENKADWHSMYKTGTAYGFEGSSYTADGYYQPGDNNWAPVYDSSVKVSGNKSIKFHVDGAWGVGGGGKPGSYLYTSGGGGANTGDVWIRTYFRVDLAGGALPTNYQKVIDSQGSAGQLYWDLNSGGWSAAWQTAAGNARYDVTDPYGGPVLGRQYCLEFHWRALPARSYTAYIDGVQVLTGTDIVSADLQYILLGIINWEGTSSAFSENAYYDNFAISSSRIYPSSKIEASGDGITWKYQEPVTLGDSTSQIKFSTSGLFGTDYRIRVTNNRNEVSGVYFLSGAGGDTTAPVVTVSTADPSNITTTPLSISGTASDAGGVSGCKWRLGAQPDGVNGAALTGTTAWSGFANSFTSGANTLHVGCYDGANNWGYDSIVVNYTPAADPAVTFFSEGFEDSAFSGRTWYDNTNHGTIVAGGYSGNCLQWAWAQGDAQPTNGGSMRRLFPETDSLYVSFWVKFQTGWRGSQQTYHPHMITIPSNLDDEYAPLANNYLNTYIETISDLGAPYTIRPVIALQDQQRVNTTSGTPPLDLTATTENRSVTYCNQPVPAGASGICYPDNPYYSANVWKSNSSISTNAWHHFEVYLRMNTISGGVGQSDGIMREWIDGTQVINHTDVQYRTNQDATKKWAQLVLSPWIGDGSPIAQTMWIDELTVGTAEPYIPVEPGPEPWRTSVPASMSGSIQ